VNRPPVGPAAAAVLGDRRRLAIAALLAFAAALAIVAWQASREPPPYPIYDALGYLRIASNLRHHGVFASGGAGPEAAPRPDAFFTPLYPGFVAALLLADPRLDREVRCVLEHQEDPRGAGCTRRFTTMLYAQVAVAALAVWLVWLSALVLSRSTATAGVAMLLAALSGRYGYYAERFLTENLLLPLLTASSLALLLAWRRPSWRRCLACGLLLGLTALVRPAHAYLLYFLLLALPAALLARERRAGPAARAATGLAAGYLLAVGPWLIRNYLVLGAPVLTAGYAGYILVQRVAYNAMTWREWLVAFVYWLPDFGDWLAAKYIDPELWARLTFHLPQSFYRVGNGELRARTLAAAGSGDAYLGYLLREYVLAQPLRHLLVTLPLAWRGIWVAKYWGLLSFLFFVPTALRSARRRAWDFLVFAAPAWFMLLFNAAVSVNVVRYNIGLIPSLAIAVALCLSGAARRLRRALGRREDDDEQAPGL